MRRNLEHRLLAIEIGASKRVEIWVDQGDGTVRNLASEQVAREEVVAQRHHSDSCVIIISETDARL